MMKPGRFRGKQFPAIAIALTLSSTLAGAPRCLSGELPEISLTSPQKLLSQEEASEKDGAARASAVRCEVLIHFGRLIPEQTSAEEIAQLAKMLKAGADQDIEAVRARVASFPPADQLVFNGQGYEGGNFGFIDAVLGMQGRPIALDREPPVFLVPLTPDAEEALGKKQQEPLPQAKEPAFREIGGDLSLEAAEDAKKKAAPKVHLEEGESLRPYCGRFDDLYFHLFQNGNAASALAFTAVEDGLSDREYHPTTGLVSRELSPHSRFNLNDILSGGGLSAIRTYAASKAGRGTNAFKGFAYRVMPAIISRVGASLPGDVLRVAETDVQRALHSGQRLYPTRVPPLYVSPDRFLGWVGSMFTPVANVIALPQDTMESYCPLPKWNSDNGDKGKPANSNARDSLFESSSTNDLVWEDPQESNLLADPEETKARKHIFGKTLTAKAPKPAVVRNKPAGFRAAPRTGDLLRETAQATASAAEKPSLEVEAPLATNGPIDPRMPSLDPRMPSEVMASETMPPEPKLPELKLPEPKRAEPKLPELKPPTEQPRRDEPAPAKNLDTRPAPPARLIAVVAPTAAETESYLAAIQANDDRLRAAEQLLGRARELKNQLKIALSSLPPAPESDVSLAIAGDLASLNRCEQETLSERLKILGERAEARAKLERRLVEERVAPLRALGRNERQAISDRDRSVRL